MEGGYLQEVHGRLLHLLDVGNATNSTSCLPSSNPEEDEVSLGLTAMGTCLVVGASFISCFGVNLQKLSHNINDSKPLEERSPMYLSWRWWLGIIAMIMGSVMDMAALPFIPLSRVAALGASGMVANIIITPIFLHEKLTKHDIIGGCITVAGTTLACYFGASTEPKVTSQCLLEYFKAKMFIGYGICVLTLLAVLLYLMEGFRRMQKKAVENGLVVEILECCWVHENLEAIHKLIHEDMGFPFFTKFGPQFYPIVHAVYAGTIGAQSVMFAKAVLIFFKNAVAKRDPGTSSGLVFAFLVPTVLCLWNQIRYLNVALQIYRDALFVTPVYQALWIAVGIMSGLIFYQEYTEIEGYRIGMFALGTLMTLVGLWILAQRKSRTITSRLEAEAPQQESTTKLDGSGKRVSLTPYLEKRLSMSFNRPLAPVVADSYNLNIDTIALSPVTTPVKDSKDEKEGMSFDAHLNSSMDSGMVGEGEPLLKEKDKPEKV